MRAAIAVLVFAAACGAKPTPVVMPTLPGDGDTNTAKPPPPRTKPAADPWESKTLIGPPEISPPQSVDLAAMVSFKLSNGLEVHVIPDQRLPVVSMQLVVKAGRADEPVAYPGVAELAADLLVKGTRTRDAAGIAKLIDSVGGTITADATFEATVLSCSVLRRELDTCLTIVPEMVEQPKFASDEFTKMRDQLRGSLAQRLSDPATVATVHAQNLLWTNQHVRGRVTSDLAIAQITRDEVIAWHKAWFTPANSMLVVVGDVDAKRVQSDIERAFGGWAKAPVPPHPQMLPPGLNGTRIRLVDWPGLPQAQIRVAQFGIQHTDPRFFDTLVFNYILGGNPQSRLSRVIKTGGASTFDRNADAGSFVVSTSARNTDAVVTTEVVLGEITKMAKEGPTDGEVAQAIASISGSWGLRFQTVADVGAALVGAELHGFGEEYLKNYGIAVGHVDPGSARQAAQAVLDPKNFVIVIVGDAKDIEPQLAKKGWRYDKVPFTAQITPVVTPDVDPKRLAAAKKFLDDALVAKGGRAKLQALTSVRLTETGTTTAAGHPAVAVDMERVLVVPDKLRIDARFASGAGGAQTRVVYAADGAKGWVQQPDPSDPTKMVVQDIPPPQMGAIDFERWRDTDTILLKATDPAAKVTPLADDDIGGKPQTVIKLASPFVGVDVTLYFDKATKLMTRMTYDEGGFTSSDEFADYKPIDGVQIAHKRPTHDRARDIELTVKKAEVNVQIAPSSFVKPASATPATTTAPANPGAK
jgi:predicted Zn-dependent peptidase|nr:pitrilysin family protein [Kofleriaceae bacterium]